MSEELVKAVLRQDFRSREELDAALGRLSGEEWALLTTPGLHDEPSEAELEALGPAFVERVVAKAVEGARLPAAVPRRSAYLFGQGLRLLALLREIDAEERLEAADIRSSEVDADPELRQKKALLASGLVDLWEELRREAPGPKHQSKPASHSGLPDV